MRQGLLVVLLLLSVNAQAGKYWTAPVPEPVNEEARDDKIKCYEERTDKGKRQIKCIKVTA